MKKLILICVLLGFLAAHALGDSTPWSPHLGGWDPDHPRATHQYWDFEQENVEPDGVYWDWTAYPTERDNPGTVVALIAADTYSTIAGFYTYNADNGYRPGFLDPVEIEVLMEISNFPDGLYKEIWVDVWYAGNLIEPGAEGQGPEAPYDTVYLGTGGPSGEADFGFRIYPNPDKDDIWFTIVANGGYAGLFGIHVDTICPNIPAPGAILLGGIGVCFVGWLRRRRAL